MTAAASFPDVEDLLCNVLPDMLGTSVGTKVPTERGRFVRVERTGGPRHTRVSDNATVLVESWADDEYQAALLAATVRLAVAELAGKNVGGVWVYHTDEESGPANLPDPRSAQARYTQTFSIHLRGATP